jgi:hypothetical protein
MTPTRGVVGGEGGGGSEVEYGIKDTYIVCKYVQKTLLEMGFMGFNLPEGWQVERVAGVVRLSMDFSCLTAVPAVPDG